MNSVIIVAAGTGSRAKLKENKIFWKIDKTPCLLKTLNAFIDSGVISEYLVAANEKELNRVKELLPPFVKVVVGGASRTQSVKNALNAVTGDIVLIHDAARPFVSSRIIKDCVNCATEHGSAIPVTPTPDTVCLAKGEKVLGYCGKEGLFSVQTPQAFCTEEIKKAYAFAGDTAFNDDGEVYKARFQKLFTVNGDKANIKLTYPEDFSAKEPEYRFGVGFDCHRLVENRKLILGGVTVPHDKGLLGHSDADALTHAVMDAILSAAGLPDIGVLFPDSDPAFEGISSMKLLATVMENVKEAGYKVKGVSGVIMAEKPKMAPVIPEIRSSLSKALGVDYGEVNISATTTEKLGIIGNEKGVAASAIAILTR